MLCFEYQDVNPGCRAPLPSLLTIFAIIILSRSFPKDLRSFQKAGEQVSISGLHTNKVDSLFSFHLHKQIVYYVQTFASYQFSAK